MLTMLMRDNIKIMPITRMTSLNRLIDGRPVNGSNTPCPLEVRRGGEGTPGLSFYIGKKGGIMPVRVKKIDGYRVTHNGKTSAKKTTKAKAEAQARLLQGVRRGWVPTGKPARIPKKATPKAAKKPTRRKK